MNQVIGRNPLDSLGTPTHGFSVVNARNGNGKGRGQATTKLNLVSLMDIFTILVFFLMLNSGDVEVLQPDERIQLPSSTATLKPNNAPVIKITRDAIQFGDQTVVSLSQLQAGDSVAELESILKAYAIKNAADIPANQSGNVAGLTDVAATTEGAKASAISIMSDADVSYAVLKRVLYASAQSGYRDIGLATEYKSDSLVANSSSAK